MARLLAWLIVIGVFLLAGEGFNLIRIAILTKMSTPTATIWWQVVLGIALMFGGIAFLGGLIHFRDRKRGKPGSARRKQASMVSRDQHPTS